MTSKVGTRSPFFAKATKGQGAGKYQTEAKLYPPSLRDLSYGRTKKESNACRASGVHQNEVSSFTDVSPRGDFLLVNGATKQGGTVFYLKALVSISPMLFGVEYLQGFFMSKEDKITKNIAALIKPNPGEVECCSRSLGATCLGVVSAITNGLATDHMDYGEVERARQQICLIQRACPIANHASPAQRAVLPCGAAKEEIEFILGRRF